MADDLRIDIEHLLDRLQALAEIGAIGNGGCCRLALTDADKAGRDRVRAWMDELGLSVTVDRIGNVIGVRAGQVEGPPVLMGSHIDTVATGGRYDGNLGVLAGLEVIRTLERAGVTTVHPIGVGFFTNEEGARFAPDMMGSGVHQGKLDVDACLASVGIDGATVKDELERIGYAGSDPCGGAPRAFFELHIEQGPVLFHEGITIGAVESVQGISWTEVLIEGVSNHAGTAPMSMRNDAGYAAAAIGVFVRDLVLDIGAPQVGTVGAIDLGPNLINVVANRARVTVDLRNTSEALLREAEARTHAFLDQLAEREGVTITRRSLARFEPVEFDPDAIALVEAEARRLGYSVRRLPSGAGHDAQMFAPNCPTAMIFVPSVDGISHNVNEFTEAADLEAGANVLLHVVLKAAAGAAA